MTASLQALLEVKNLSIEFLHRKGNLQAIHDLTLTMQPGEILGMVGESGAGKSLTGAAIAGLLQTPGRIRGGEIWFGDRRIDNLDDEARRQLRGKAISCIFQDPLTSLNPVLTIGQQLIETIRTHLPLSANEARERAVSLLTEVGINSPLKRIDQYPHQLSGGMRQRVVIALALCVDPQLVIADEPTTALDVSVQAQVLGVLRRLCEQHGTAVMLITHDMGVVAEVCSRVAVMYAGRIVETGPVAQVIRHPQHPYTRGLIQSIPSMSERHEYLKQIDGAMPRLNALPQGCAFNPRCPHASAQCREQQPLMHHRHAAQLACFHPQGESL
ncbi:Glutathione import ATP-binding protein GsiA [Raoultella terrigena]|uniref:ABC transporter ATP-binding protein n=1 Tax=Raoultella terrigena TaxID=577 RepID=UPI000E0546B5|nr:ABC transporter ATP-binding protein [Raoultella terrigena]SUQ58066.1 Glutathione import ATP-binding protein GsiA [Raoultella terrigena]